MCVVKKGCATDLSSRNRQKKGGWGGGWQTDRQRWWKKEDHVVICHVPQAVTSEDHELVVV